MSEWKKVKLGEITDVRDGTHDSPKQKDEGRFLITSKHIKNSKINFTSAYKISIEDYEKVNYRSKVDKYDILFSMIGTIGEMTIVDFEPDFAIKNIGLFKVGGDKTLAMWIYYYLKSNEAQAEIDASLKGSTQQYITLGDLRKFPILLPPLPVQKAIAEVLSNLDDKIDLLHRQNQTLEEMAETLFRQWFIEERDESWEEGKLEDILSVKGGSTPSSKNSEYWDGDINWTTPRDITNLSSTFLLKTSRRISKKGLTKISSGYLPVGTILLSSRAPVGYLAITDIETSINQGYIAIIDDKEYSKYWIFSWLKANMETIKMNSNGSTFMEINKSTFRKLSVIKPPLELRTIYDNYSKDFFDKIKHNAHQIRTLEFYKDILLPKLMSGEVRVKHLTKEFNQ